MKLLLLFMLCLLGSSSSQKSVSTLAMSKTSGSRGHMQTNCTCVNETMDCSSKGKTTFGRNDRCENQSIFRLDLSENKIASLPKDAFALLTNLKELILETNSISELSKEIFSDSRNLRELMLSQNNLKGLPEGIFSGLSNLKTISLFENKLLTIPNRLFAGLRSLKSVMLSDNQLPTLPADTFSGLHSMVLIDLARNRLTNVPRGLFQGIRSIKFLDLSGNQLTSISPEDLNGIRDIYRLELTENMIISIPQYDTKWPKIKSSYWAENRIERISEVIVRSWLGNGEDRLLSMQMYDPASTTVFQAADLQWVVSDNKIRTEVNEVDCRCGMLTLEKARIVLCVNVACGPGHAHADWVAALRAAGRPQGDGGPRPPAAPRTSPLQPLEEARGRPD